MDILATLFGGLGLFFIGVKLIGRNLQHMAGPRFRRAVSKATGHPVSAALAGTALGVLTQSTNAATFIAINLITAGVTTVARAMPLVAWANLGTAALVLLASVDLRLAVLYLLGGIGICHYLDLDKSARHRHTVGALLGLALLFLGLQFLKGASVPLRGMSVVQEVLQFAASSDALLLVIGAAVTMVAQSSSAVSVLAVTMAAAGLFGEPETIMLVLGASLGSGFTTFVMAGNLDGTPRQLAIFQALFKAVGVIILLPLFVAEEHYGVPLLRDLIDDVVPGLPQRIAVVFVLCQIVPALVLAPLRRPLARLLGRLAPPSRSETLSRPVFLYEQALVDGEGALPLVEREQERLIRRLPDYLDGVRAERTAGGADPVPYEELHTANTAVAAAIQAFQTELLDGDLTRAALEHGVVLKARLEIIRSLNDSLHELVHLIVTAPEEAQGQPLTDSLMESLHALLMTLADSVAEGGDAETLVALTSDRTELMERIRRSLLRTEAPPPYPVQQALFAQTSVFERVVWLLRRYALLLRPREEMLAAAE